MAIKWIHGDFATGAINENDELPVGGNNDKSTVDVNAGDNSTISMSKRELGANWKDIISEGVTLVAEVDTDAAWDSPNAVRTGGWVNKIDGRINDLITAQIVGYREYLAARICTPFASGGTDKPKTGVKFEAGTWQGLMALIAIDSFKPIQGAGDTQPPTNLGTVFADTSGTGVQRATRLADAEYYAAILDDIRDNLSPKGNEYRFVLRWKDSSKTSMVWDVYVGNDADGKINWAGSNTNIVLDAEDFAHLDFKLSLSSEKLANRVIAQSKAGSDDTNSGADYTVVTESNGLPLFDTFWNPGQELDSAKLLEGAVARVKDLKTPKGTASYEVKGEVSYWKAKLGSQLTFSGGTDIDTSGYDIVVRCTGVNWSASNKKITIDVMLPQARYPRLPSSKSKSDNPLLGGSDFAGGGTGTPVGGGYQGGNSTGIGNNYKFDELEPPYVAPIAVPETNESSRISCGSAHALAISNDGKLYSWGGNGYGQLGLGWIGANGNGQDYEPNPMLVNNDTDWKAVFAVRDSSYAIKNDNSLWAWGSGAYGQLGTGTTDNKGIPTKVLENVKTLWAKALIGIHIIKQDGTLWAAGLNQDEQLGLGVSDVFVLSFRQLGSKNDWVKIESSGDSNTATLYLAALDSQGTLWEWGQSRIGKSSVPTVNAPNVKFKDISITYNSNGGGMSGYCAGITTDGTLYTWGGGYHDTSGTVQWLNYPTPYGGGITTVHSLSYCGPTDLRPYDTQLVIKTDGTLWAFGRGHSYSIVQECATPFEYGGQTGFDWRKPYIMRTTQQNLLAIVNDGELWGGGFNNNGELGRGDRNTTRPLFYNVGGSTGWVRVDTAGFSLAVKNDDMYATGSNGVGQLGLGYNNGTISSWTIQPSSNPTI